jgi:hypothetical protein
MDEHPGDTLGKRFLTFWGALAAIAAVAVLLGLYRWIALPSDTQINDGGAGLKRLETLQTVNTEQRKELTTVAEVKPGEAVRIPPDKAIPYAVSVLAAQSAKPSAVKTPATLAREATANPAPAPAPATTPAPARPAPAPAPATPAPGTK